MQSNKFATEEIVSGRDARGNGESYAALVGNELVDGPLAVGEAVVVDL